jgi:hypothetical protein
MVLRSAAPLALLLVVATTRPEFRPPLPKLRQQLKNPKPQRLLGVLFVAMLRT